MNESLKSMTIDAFKKNLRGEGREKRWDWQEVGWEKSK